MNTTMLYDIIGAVLALVWGSLILAGMIMGLSAFLESSIALTSGSEIRGRWLPLFDVKAGMEPLVKEYRRLGFRLLVLSPILFTMLFPFALLIIENGLVLLPWYLVQMYLLVLVCRKRRILLKHKNELIEVGLISEIDCEGGC